jgi:penicillin-binding protein 2
VARGQLNYQSQIPSKRRRPARRGLAEHEQWVESVLPAEGGATVVEPAVSRRPLWLLVGLILVSFGLLVIRLFGLQMVEGDRNLGLANGNRIRQKVIRAPRGIIYDRNKQMLARNQASFDVTVVPRQLPREADARQEVYGRVSAHIGVPVAEIQAAAESKTLEYAQFQLVASGVERDKALAFDAASAALPGFSLDVNPIREYIDGGWLAHILGYTGRIGPEEIKTDRSYLPTDYIGKLGIEKQYESLLRGSNGSEQTEVDSSEKPVKVLANKPSVAGSNLVLSIDLELQKQLTAAIQKQLEAAGSPRGSGVALNPKTGEVLAMVSLPRYDNNLFARGISQADYSRLANDPGQPLFNKVAMGAYPTGSIIKPLVASAALQERVITPETTVNDTGAITLENKYDKSITYTFRSYEAGGHGVLNVYKAIALSSNVFFYTIGGGYGQIAGLGVDRLASYYSRFGYGQKTGIDLPDETAGYLPTPASKLRLVGEPWVLGDTYNISVGQGDLRVSPLQQAVAIASIANGGQILKPHILKQVVDETGKVIQETKPEVVRQNFIDKAHLNVVRAGMRQVITSGTACCLIEQQVPVKVAAKTGTAETDPDGKRKPQGWFEAYAPYEDPQIVMVVLIENSGEGAQYAAPAVREVLKWFFSR